MKIKFLCIALIVILGMPFSCETDHDDSGNNTGGEAETVTEAEDDNASDHDQPDDYVIDTAGMTNLICSGTSITTSSANATVVGTKVTLTAPGTYAVRGTLTNGQIVVNSATEGVVKIVLQGVSVTSSNSAPLYIKAADKVVLYLPEGSQNTLVNGGSFVFEDVDAEEPNAALFSKADLTLFGDGSLSVTSASGDGITSKDGLIIDGVTLAVKAADDGIRGKDYLVVHDGNLTVTASGDGLKSDNTDDTAKGYVMIKTGIFSITSGGDGLAAATDVLIQDGAFTITSGGGYAAGLVQNASAKAIKGEVYAIIESGSFLINSADDALHSGNKVVLNGGTVQISTGDDGLHSDGVLEINGGTLTIATSYEGIEGVDIRINSGDIRVTASDDGINGAGGAATTTQYGQATSGSLTLKDGNLLVNADGDGVDINGSIVMEGGTLIVQGPTNNGNGALDYDGTCKMTGGTLIAAGSSGMAMAPGTTSSVCSVLINFSSSKAAGTLLHLEGADGSSVLTFKPAKACQSLCYADATIKKGSSYSIYTGGSVTGTSETGVYTGTYSGGTLYTSFTVSGIVTTLGSSGTGPRP